MANHSTDHWLIRVLRKLIKKEKLSILEITNTDNQVLKVLREEIVGNKWEKVIIEKVSKEELATMIPEKHKGLLLLNMEITQAEMESMEAIYRELLDRGNCIILYLTLVDMLVETGETWLFSESKINYKDENKAVYVGEGNKSCYIRLEELICPTYGIYGCYKNDEKLIEERLTSYLGADEILLCDLGSTDESTAIIEAFAKKNPQVKVRTVRLGNHPQRMDDTKNTGLFLLSSTVDIGIDVGSNYVLTKGWKEILNKSWDIKYTRYRYQVSKGKKGTLQWEDCIHIRHGYLWKRPIYAYLEYKDEERLFEIQAKLMHSREEAYDVEERIALLKQGIKECPEDWQLKYYLAETYLAHGQMDKCFRLIEKGISSGEKNSEFLYLKYKYFRQLEQDNLALACLNQSVALRFCPAYLFEKAIYLYELGRYIEAYSVLLEMEAQGINNAMDKEQIDFKKELYVKVKAGVENG